MPDLAQINLERGLSGIEEATKVVGNLARLAVANNGDPIILAQRIEQVAAGINALALDVRAKAPSQSRELPNEEQSSEEETKVAPNLEYVFIDPFDDSRQFHRAHLSGYGHNSG